MAGLVILTVVIAVLTAIITLIWWKVGDQWADDEYKKFGHGGGAPKGPPPEVIKDFNAISGTESSAPKVDDEKAE
ncbi:MAG: hypothetical protein KDA29_03300 [Phycisphaerales bacterium]|nr:hypothetical protein [Phycisphaerales bacterium]